MLSYLLSIGCCKSCTHICDHYLYHLKDFKQPRFNVCTYHHTGNQATMVRNTYLSSKNCCFLIISIAEFWFALSSTAQGDQSSSLLSATNNSNNQPQPYITDITQETNYFMRRTNLNTNLNSEPQASSIHYVQINTTEETTTYLCKLLKVFLFFLCHI